VLATGAVVLSSLELSLSRSRVLLSSSSEVISVFSGEVSGSVVGRVSVDHGTKSVSSSVNGSVLEGEVSDVVFIDHAENWLLLNVVVLGLLVVLLLSSFEFSESIVTDEVGSDLLGLAVVAVQGSGETTGSKTVQISLFRAFNLKVGFGLVRLLYQVPVFVPVIV